MLVHTKYKLALLVAIWLPTALFAQTISDLLPDSEIAGKHIVPPTRFGYSPVSVYADELPSGNSILANYCRKYVSSQVPYTLQMNDGFFLVDNAILTIGNGNTEMESVKKRVQFSIKKDDLSNICYNKSTGELVVLNHANKPCDMSAFDISVESNAYVINNGNFLKARANVIDFALEKIPRRWDILITHRETSTQVRIPCSIKFEHVISLSPLENGNGRSCIYALLPLKTDEKIYMLLNVESGDISVVQLPFMITAYGRNGRNGIAGTDGTNGTNESSWTDSDGKVHHTAGTRGTAGGNGTDATDGGNSGNILMCIPLELAETDFFRDVRMVARKGFGGVGGRAGRGGRHGAGSGASGYASSGVAGKDGRDGSLGELIYLVVDTKQTIEKFDLLNRWE